MKEITTVFIAKITFIEKHLSDEAAGIISGFDRDTLKSNLEKELKTELAIDDIHIRDLKLFIRDEEETDG